MFRRSVLTLAVVALALVVSAQAHASNGLSSPEDAVAGAVEELRGLGIDPDSNAPPQVPPEVRQAAEEAEDEADVLVEEVQRTADPDSLYAKAMDLARPAHTALDDAQRQVDGLLYEDEPEPEQEPTITPAMEANSAIGWPELSPPMLLLAGTAAGLGMLLWFLGQTATVGAGAAGTAVARDGRRFLPYASPLFTRFEKDTVLGHPKREAIYGHIVHTPGITLQDLCTESGLSRTAVTHHLRLLEQQHLVVSKRVGRSRHFFENGGRYGRHQKDAYAVLHNDRSKDIHAFIRQNPGAIQKDLCSAFDIQASVAHWHVKRLVEADLVEAVRRGRTVSYFPSAPVAAGAAPSLERAAAPMPA